MAHPGQGFFLMTLELPGYGRSSGKTFVSKPWAEQDVALLIRALGTLSDDPATTDLKVLRLFNADSPVPMLTTTKSSLPMQGRVTVFAEGLGSAAFVRAYSEVHCHLQCGRGSFHSCDMPFHSCDMSFVR